MLKTYDNILSESDSQGGRHGSRRSTDKSGSDILQSLASGSHDLSFFVFFFLNILVYILWEEIFFKCNSSKVISLKYVLNVHD